MVLIDQIKKAEYIKISSIHGITILHRRIEGNPFYLLVQNDWPMLLLENLKNKLIIVNKWFEFEPEKEYEGDILSTSNFKKIGRIKFHLEKGKLNIYEIEGKIEYTWNLVDIHTPLKINPLNEIYKIIEKYKPIKLGLINIYTDPLSLNSFVSMNYFLPPLLYGYSGYDTFENIYNGIKIRIKFSNNPIFFSYPEDYLINSAEESIKKIENLGY